MAGPAGCACGPAPRCPAAGDEGTQGCGRPAKAPESASRGWKFRRLHDLSNCIFSRFERGEIFTKKVNSTLLT